MSSAFLFEFSSKIYILNLYFPGGNSDVNEINPGHLPLLPLL